MSLARFYLVGFALLLVFDTSGAVGFKLAGTSAGEPRLETEWLGTIFASPWIYVAVAAYVGAFFTWMTLLEHAPIGPAFAASHMEIVSVLAVSVLWLGETLTAVQLLGCVLILAGIAVLGWSEISGEGPPSEP